MCSFHPVMQKIDNIHVKKSCFEKWTEGWAHIHINT